MSEKERWKKGVTKTGLVYRVSNLGGIKVPGRWVKYRNRYGDGKRQFYVPAFTPKQRNTKGYLTVSLDGIIYHVHCLVAEAHVPNPEGRLYVHHKDRNGLNPRANNLRWVTKRQHDRIHSGPNYFRTSIGKTS